MTNGLVVTTWGREPSGPATIMSIFYPGITSGTFVDPSGIFSDLSRFFKFFVTGAFFKCSPSGSKSDSLIGFLDLVGALIFSIPPNSFFGVGAGAEAGVSGSNFFNFASSLRIDSFKLVDSDDFG